MVIPGCRIAVAVGRRLLPESVSAVKTVIGRIVALSPTFVIGLILLRDPVGDDSLLSQAASPGDQHLGCGHGHKHDSVLYRGAEGGDSLLSQAVFGTRSPGVG